MKLRTFVLLLVFLLIALFAILNWSAFNEPQTLSLGVTSVVAPLGVVMLALVAALSAVFLAVLFYVQTSALLDSRRHARELRAQRELAEDAESSRFVDLRTFLANELAEIRERGEASREAFESRLGSVEAGLRAAITDSGNTIAAYVGEVDERLERAENEGRAKLPAPKGERSA